MQICVVYFDQHLGAAHSECLLKYGEVVVTPTQKRWIILLFNIIEIFHKFKKFEYHQIQKLTNKVDLKKQDFLIQYHFSSSIKSFSVKLTWRQICLKVMFTVLNFGQTQTVTFTVFSFGHLYSVILNLIILTSLPIIFQSCT